MPSWRTRAAAPGGRGRAGFFAQIARLALGRTPLDEESIRDALAYVDARHDCADFTVAGLLRVLYQFSTSPLLPADLVAAIRRTLLGFKYWIDEPGRELMCFWSENHQIMFHSGEYLAGQLCPDEVFPNAGLTGRRAHGKGAAQNSALDQPEGGASGSRSGTRTPTTTRT